MKIRKKHTALASVLAVGTTLTALALSSSVTQAAEAPRQPAATTMADLVAKGPEKITTQEYDFGDDAAKLPGVKAPVELRGVVHRPAQAAGRKLPFVLLLHGIQITCWEGPGKENASMDWPCQDGLKPVPSHRGYDYLAENLASHGFVVASISANGVYRADADFEDMGMLNRARLIERHLEEFARWNTTGAAPFGQSLVGAIDPQRVGLMGHSRGGGGVARFMTYKKQKTGFTVKAVLPLAAAPHGKQVITDAALGVVEATCDGDTYQHTAISLVDRSRYAKPEDPSPKYTVAITGANHNFFNTAWSPSADWIGGYDDARHGPQNSICKAGAQGRLTETQQRRYATAYVNSFFRLHLAGEQRLAPVWNGETKPAGDVVQVTRIPGAQDRLVINRLDSAKQLRTNDLGGAVTRKKLSQLRICSKKAPLTKDSTPCLSNTRKVPTSSAPHHIDGDLPLAKTAWKQANASLTNAVPRRHRDFSKYSAVQLRAALDFSDQRNPPNKNGKLTITLTDTQGRSKTVTPDTAALDFPRMVKKVPPGQEDLSPHFLLNQVRVPLRSFTGVDLKNARSVRIGFPSKSGSFGLSDLMLSW
ncbi:alpha/beta hydrolase family protein [Kineosporia babensis]|uniref:PET hydrolase/cutinase-like domain-containing protein n=1 Tax=Kineosporia babensis TaxID=499548 RepID=A0A9X1SWL0_9ACTN|nr:hypothetical protein [Kineosporia babensis]MCD5314859.1 hypothetical protein [Kineosporia babensis]